MKKLMKLCAAALAAVAVLSLAGCSARSPITADEFTKQAKAAGFTAAEQTAPSGLNVDKMINATKGDAEVMFLTFKTDSAAEDMYKSMKSEITQGTSGTSTNLDSSTYSKYTLVNGELHHTLSRMNSTIIYAKSTTASKDPVDKLLTAVKY